jgi:predicted enzyme related to lactoylglutathione lyase
MADSDFRIDYIELPALDIARSKSFYEIVFGWRFTDYGPDYSAFEDGRLAGGLTKERAPAEGGALIVIHAAALEAAEAKVRQAGATITAPIFSFPGGRRFQFLDPAGNELAVWSNDGAA